MEYSQTEKRRVASMKRCTRVIYFVGRQAESLTASLESLPIHLAIIEAMQDEAKRREAKVVVRETVQMFAAVRRKLYRTIIHLEALVAELEEEQKASSV
ncbi:MAG: hypothetical protein R3E58_01165 [Phycisphaerae bacterium]|nr:hypothetical protein [Phycisphaerales bacterium]